MPPAASAVPVKGTLLFDAPVPVAVPVAGRPESFPVHRVYCVGRNYEDHAREMGFTGREPPFFFMKPADALLVVAEGAVGAMPYPALTRNLHHEIELVVALGKGGRDVKAADAMALVFGYAVGLDMTRRDLQNQMKKEGRPWEVGKAFERSGPIGPITPKEAVPDISTATITLAVNGSVRQRGNISQLIWNIAETIEHLSAAWELRPGDLIFTGTPEGVGPVIPQDLLVSTIAGLAELRVRIDPDTPPDVHQQAGVGKA
jgi:fumarylpyruvate hydrolase